MYALRTFVHMKIYYRRKLLIVSFLCVCFSCSLSAATASDGTKTIVAMSVWNHLVPRYYQSVNVGDVVLVRRGYRIKKAYDRKGDANKFAHSEAKGP